MADSGSPDELDNLIAALNDNSVAANSYLRCSTQPNSPRPPPLDFDSDESPRDNIREVSTARTITDDSTHVPFRIRSVPESEMQSVLRTIDRHCVELTKQNRLLDAVEVMEHGLEQRCDFYGLEDDETRRAADRLALFYNSVSLSALCKENAALSLMLLRKAVSVCNRFRGLEGVHVQSLNNAACCYRRLRRPRTAIRILREALKVCNETDSRVDSVSLTHLNLCAILSELDRHEEALTHAQASVLHCQEQLLSQTFQEKLHTERDQHAALTERVVVLGISYHNMGVEEEHLKNFDSSVMWYTKAYHLVRDHIGPDEQITNSFRKACTDAKNAAIAWENTSARRKLLEKKQRGRPKSARPKSARAPAREKPSARSQPPPFIV